IAQKQRESVSTSVGYSLVYINAIFYSVPPPVLANKVIVPIFVLGTLWLPRRADFKAGDLSTGQQKQQLQPDKVALDTEPGSDSKQKQQRHKKKSSKNKSNKSKSKSGKSAGAAIDWSGGGGGNNVAAGVAGSRNGTGEFNNVGFEKSLNEGDLRARQSGVSQQSASNLSEIIQVRSGAASPMQLGQKKQKTRKRTGDAEEDMLMDNSVFKPPEGNLTDDGEHRDGGASGSEVDEDDGVPTLKNSCSLRPSGAVSSEKSTQNQQTLVAEFGIAAAAPPPKSTEPAPDQEKLTGAFEEAFNRRARRIWSSVTDGSKPTRTKSFESLSFESFAAAKSLSFESFAAAESLSFESFAAAESLSFESFAAAKSLSFESFAAAESLSFESFAAAESLSDNGACSTLSAEVGVEPKPPKPNLIVEAVPAPPAVAEEPKEKLEKEDTVVAVDEAGAAWVAGLAEAAGTPGLAVEQQGHVAWSFSLLTLGELGGELSQLLGRFEPGAQNLHLGLAVREIVGSPGHGVGDILHLLQLHCRINPVIGAQLLHLIAPHHNSVFGSAFALQNLQLADAAGLPLALHESVEGGPLREQPHVRLLASLHLHLELTTGANSTDGSKLSGLSAESSAAAAAEADAVPAAATAGDGGPPAAVAVAAGDFDEPKFNPLKLTPPKPAKLAGAAAVAVEDAAAEDFGGMPNEKPANGAGAAVVDDAADDEAAAKPIGAAVETAGLLAEEPKEKMDKGEAELLGAAAPAPTEASLLTLGELGGELSQLLRRFEPGAQNLHLGLAVREIVGSPGHGVGDILHLLQLHCRINPVIGAQLLHLIAPHHNSVFGSAFALQNLQLADAAGLPLALHESVEGGPLREQPHVRLLATADEEVAGAVAAAAVGPLLMPNDRPDCIDGDCCCCCCCCGGVALLPKPKNDNGFWGGALPPESVETAAAAENSGRGGSGRGWRLAKEATADAEEALSGCGGGCGSCCGCGRSVGALQIELRRRRRRRRRCRLMLMVQSHSRRLVLHSVNLLLLLLLLLLLCGPWLREACRAILLAELADLTAIWSGPLQSSKAVSISPFFSANEALNDRPLASQSSSSARVQAASPTPPPISNIAAGRELAPPLLSERAAIAKSLASASSAVLVAGDEEEDQKSARRASRRSGIRQLRKASKPSVRERRWRSNIDSAKRLGTADIFIENYACRVAQSGKSGQDKRPDSGGRTPAIKAPSYLIQIRPIAIYGAAFGVQIQLLLSAWR
uniref:FH2 domain-containing protein n=1 Tax=Macrostomum lignano TaxID=282301 RepID=A0A1I8H2N6_9PLAT